LSIETTNHPLSINNQKSTIRNLPDHVATAAFGRPSDGEAKRPVNRTPSGLLSQQKSRASTPAASS
jgi:hypothetical protein